jgi:branched-chain amino acid transport system substrate-binding protein
MLGSDYDQGLVYYFTEAFEALGGTVVNEDFPEGSANFVSYVNNAKAANAGVIFAPVSINYAQLIVEASAAQGYEGALLGSDTWDNNKVIEAATGTDISAFVTTFYQEGGAPEFDSGIKEWLNANPDQMTNNGGNDMIAAVTAIGYDAYLTALEALKIAGSPDRAAVLEAMPQVSFEGVTGLIEFDDIGDAKRDGAFIKTANTETGVWDFVKVQTVG